MHDEQQEAPDAREHGAPRIRLGHLVDLELHPRQAGADRRPLRNVNAGEEQPGSAHAGAAILVLQPPVSGEAPPLGLRRRLSVQLDKVPAAELVDQPSVRLGNAKQFGVFIELVLR